MTATLRMLTVFACGLLSFTANSTDYIFTGSGDWTSSVNWLSGIMPSGPVTSGQTVIIRGNVSVNNVCVNCSANTLLNNGGTIIVDAGATLTLQNLSQFTQIGDVIVNGTFINKTSLEIFANNHLTINGTFINQSTLTNKGNIVIGSGAKWENQLSAHLISTAEGNIIIHPGGTIMNKNSSVLQAINITNNGTINNGSTLAGNTSLKGSLTNNGTIAPGDGIGKYKISGSYAATTNSMHNFELGGTDDASYDKLEVTGTVQLDGVLNVTLANGFVPSTDHDLPIITGNIKGTFSSVFKPAKYTVVYNTNSVVLRYNTSLPMLYIRLDVKKEGTAAKLSWEIHNEPSVVLYEIERSTDGKNYQKIGVLNATQVGKYNFTDSSPKEKNYYRVKVIDIGGAYRYSSVISLNQGKTSIALNVYPSPALNTITVQHSSAAPDSKLLLTSADGRIVKALKPQSGAQQTVIDLSSIQKGMYVVQFQNGVERTEALLFTKQ